MNKIELSILIPVRNEERSVPIMVRILHSALQIPHEVLIVYDFPQDSTIPVVKKLQSNYPHVHLVHNTYGVGVTNAIKAGVYAATGKYILIFAADEIGPVVAIEDMCALAKAGCRLVSCTRYARGGKRLGGSLVGGLFSCIANYYMHTVAGMSLTDATTGIKLFRRTDFEKFQLRAKGGWAAAFELAIKAQLLGMQLGEVPIVSVDRLFGGVSSFQLGPWVKEYCKWLLWGTGQLAFSPHRNSKVLTIQDIH